MFSRKNILLQAAVVNCMSHSLTTSLKSLSPDTEYIVRYGWIPGSHHIIILIFVSMQIWVQLLDRSQQHLKLVVIPAAAFTSEETNSSQMRVLLEEV